jgi:hypothetical protein
MWNLKRLFVCYFLTMFSVKRNQNKLKSISAKSNFIGTSVFVHHNHDIVLPVKIHVTSYQLRIKSITNFICCSREFVMTVIVSTDFNCSLFYELLSKRVLLAYKSKNFGRFLPNIFSIRLIRGSQNVVFKITFFHLI